MRRMGLALHGRMTICQKLPKNFEQKLLNYQWYITNVRKTGNFLMGQIASADETAIYLDMPPNYTEKTRPLELLTSPTLSSQLYTCSHIKTTQYSLREQTATKPNSSPLSFVNYLAHINCPMAGDSNFIKINVLKSRRNPVYP
jgi:hypothetical protein